MYRLVVAFAIALSLAAPDLYAGPSDPSPAEAPSGIKLSQEGFPGTAKAMDFGGLLDMERLSFKNTAGIRFQSGEFGGMSQYYLNTITYRASKPLVIRAQVGIENTMFGNATLTSANGGSARLVVPYLGIQYHPRENLMIDISISHRPMYYGYYGGFPY